MASIVNINNTSSKVILNGSNINKTLKKLDFKYLQCNKPDNNDLKKLNHALDSFDIKKVKGQEYVNDFVTFRKIADKFQTDAKVSNKLKVRLLSKLLPIIK